MSIDCCPLKKVDSRSGCYCGIEIDGTNYIQCQPYSISQLPEFTRSYIHDKLNLSSNFVRNLTQQSFQQIKVKKIFLQNNLIESIDKHTFDNQILNYLEELHIESLTKHSIEFLCHGKWSKLRVLELIHFDFDQFESCLENVHRLEVLIIKNSQINHLFSYLNRFPNLRQLTLNFNELESISFKRNQTFPIQVLDLSFNEIRSINNEFLSHFPHLHTLDLSNNSIEYLPSLTTANNQFLNLNLSSNPLCTLEQSSTPGNLNLILHKITNLHCDCRLAFYLNDNSRAFDDRTQCSTPEQFRGRFLKDLTSEDLTSTCSNQLPIHCREVKYFAQIRKKEVSSFRLTSFVTSYENKNLIVSWDFDSNSFVENLPSIKFQILLEQDSIIIRRSTFISPYLKQYTIHHIPSMKTYYVCLLLIRSSFGTDKYCREIRTSLPTTTTTATEMTTVLPKQIFANILFTNRSIVFGFLFGTILTTGLLLTLAFICHLRSKQQQQQQQSHQYQSPMSTLYHRPSSQQQYLYIDQNDDGSFFSTTKYHHLTKNAQQRNRMCYQSWYRRATDVPLPPPCCFHHHPAMSSTSTARRLNTLSSQYSNGLDKEPMTSTSIMSSTSSEEPTNPSPAKHVYEELTDESMILKRNQQFLL